MENGKKQQHHNEVHFDEPTRHFCACFIAKTALMEFRLFALF